MAAATGPLASGLSSFTTAEVTAFKTLKDVADFVKCPPPAFAAFCVATGGEDDTLPRVFGVIP